MPKDTKPGVWVDTLQPAIPHQNWPHRHVCHHFVAPATDPEQLHTLAESIGLRRTSFQRHTEVPHYALTETTRRKALRAGAQPTTPQDVLEILYLWRQHHRPTCPLCNGHGQTGPPTFITTKTCPACGGHGTVKPPEHFTQPRKTPKP